MASPSRIPVEQQTMGAKRLTVAGSGRVNIADLWGFEGQTWRNNAACLTAPTDLFFPERGTPGEAVRDLCFQCPVRMDCLDYSVTTMQPAGWFGGHPLSGRKRIRGLLKRGVSLDRADAVALKEALTRMDRRKVNRENKR